MRLRRPKPPLQPKPKHLSGFRLNKPTSSTKAVTAPNQDHNYVNMPSIDKNTNIPPVVAVGEKQADSPDRAGASDQEEEQYPPTAVVKLFNSRIPVSMRGGGKQQQQVYSVYDRAGPKRCFSFCCRFVVRFVLPVLLYLSAKTKNKTKPEIQQNSV